MTDGVRTTDHAALDHPQARVGTDPRGEREVTDQGDHLMTQIARGDPLVTVTQTGQEDHHVTVTPTSPGDP